MDQGKKLLELLGVTSLRQYAEPTTFEELLETGQYYHDLFQNAFAKGETETERIRAGIARLLAEMLQPEARKKYGAADQAAIRGLVSETFEAAAEEEWERLMGVLKEGMGRSGLTPDQQSTFLRQMAAFRGPFIDQICSEAARLKLVPVESVNEVTLAVAEMIKEERHADQVTGD